MTVENSIRILELLANNCEIQKVNIVSLTDSLVLFKKIFDEKIKSMSENINQLNDKNASLESEIEGLKLRISNMEEKSPKLNNIFKERYSNS